MRRLVRLISRLIRSKTIQVINQKKIKFQPKRAANNPKVQLTPLPPLKFKKMENIWPIIGENERINFSVKEKVVNENIVVMKMYDLRKSSKPTTKNPLTKPSFLATLVAPILPLPNCRMSIWFNLPTRYPNGMLPIR